MTLQRRDVLVYQDERFALDRDILKSYFEAHPAKKPEKIAFETNLYRGYYASFEIINRQLLVVDIRVNVDYDENKRDIISKSVLESALADRRLCQWFSGDLMMFSVTTNSRYLRIYVKEGIVSKVEEITKQAYDSVGNHAFDYL